ncbi:MAG: Ig-like domain-containing protein [Bacteroidota bacterium]
MKAQSYLMSHFVKNCLITLLFLIFGSDFVLAQSVFINEIHYDNAAGDVNEGVEIAGTAGFILDNYALYFYDGSTNSQYLSIPLFGTIPNLQDGFGTIFFSIPGIQNGSTDQADGLAFVDNIGEIIQFISYEGVLTPINGPASGMQSSDIGVFQASSPIGTSLQLAGTGTEYSDFYWEADVASTYNAVNLNQSFSGYPDSDGDGFPDSEDLCPDTPSSQVDSDADGHGDECDCEPLDPAINPGTIWYSDIDRDGYGDINHTATSCTQPPGYVADATDFDDRDASRFPGAPCDDGSACTNGDVFDINGNCIPGDLVDCDGGCDPATGMCIIVDSDGDAFPDGEDNCPTTYNPDQADNDGDGIGDICDPDDDNDGVADEFFGAPLDNCRLVANPDQSDSDADGYGDACDCDNSNAAINPGTIWYADNDGDGFGTTSLTITACIQPSGYVLIATDFDDADASKYPGAPAPECDDGIFCTIEVYDENGNCSIVPDDTRCDDGDERNGIEYCDPYLDCQVTINDSDNDGIPDADDNCPSEPNSQQTDADGDGEGDACDCEPYNAEISSFTVWYADNDGDGFGTTSLTITSCIQPSGYVLIATDFDDTDANKYPGAVCTINPCTVASYDINGNCVPQYFEAQGTVCSGTGSVCDGDGNCVDEDIDGDGIPDSEDNCPDTYNPYQEDIDGDGIGNVCDVETCGDFVDNNGDGNIDELCVDPLYTINDITSEGAIVDGVINEGEYVGFTKGINQDFGDLIGSGSILYFDSDQLGNLFIALDAAREGNWTSASFSNDIVVIYFDVKPGGYYSTTLLSDPSTPHTEAITSTLGSQLYFAPGFEADYAIAVSPDYAGLWELTSSSLTLVKSPNISLNASAGAVMFEMDLSLTDLGLTTGDTFYYIATLINANNGYRADEFMGVSSNTITTTVGTLPVFLNDGDYNAFQSLNPEDVDGDGIPNESDNCPSAPNPDQTDTDGDGVGDACDNQVPVALNDNITTDEDAAIIIPVLENDTDDGTDPLTITATTGPANGTIVVNTDETITYTPNPNFNGDDSFTYTISDSEGLESEAATVSILIQPVNDPPTVLNDAVTVLEDNFIDIDVLANDYDVEGDPFEIYSISRPRNGTVVLNGNLITYTPNENFNGSDLFEYTATDGSDYSKRAIVNIEIQPVNDQPTAVDDFVETLEDTPINIYVLKNDFDVDDGDSGHGTIPKEKELIKVPKAKLQITDFSIPANGSVDLMDGYLLYTPNPDFNGTDMFTYTITDGFEESMPAVVTVNVISVNDPPLAVEDNFSIDYGAPATFDVLANDSDDGGVDNLSVMIGLSPSNGTLVVNTDNSLTYTHDGSYNFTDQFTYSVTDTEGLISETVNVGITILAPDEDGDGIIDPDDNCVSVSNPDQLDTDGDGIGDVCDEDDDNDGVVDANDNQPLNPYACQDADADSCDDCEIGVDGFGPLADASPDNDGPDNDADGLCDFGDPDDDNDGVLDQNDSDPFNNLACGDQDGDGCDDCSSGIFDTAADGVDTDADGICDDGDPDDDNDGIADGADPEPLNPYICGDADGDTCDDCSVGIDGWGPLADSQPANDGPDTDGDGLCNFGDPDDDNDGIADGADPEPLNPYICGDTDGDTCDDCSVGIDGFGPLADNDFISDGPDFDGDGLCDSGDPDIDNDGVANAVDSDDFNPNVCSDQDGDGCDDCSSGIFDTAADGVDTDADGICNDGDPDDDNDGIADGADPEPLNPYICGDADADSCDDCEIGVDGFGPLVDASPDNDGPDTDADGLCDSGDTDDDNDGVLDQNDSDPFNNLACGDQDGDGCDDCSSGIFDTAADGVDTDADGICNDGDPDDDNDGIADGADPEPLNPYICGDADGDTCDDCSVGIDGFGPLADATPNNDGVDTDADGLCDSGDTDDDNDGVLDQNDSDPFDPFVCSDQDADGCDDCSSGTFDPTADGVDTDGDGLCDSGDPDDDNDGCDDTEDSEPLVYGNDNDGDGFIGGCDSCDEDPNNWTAEGCNSCIDMDGDGFYTGCDSYGTIAGPDCDDSNPIINPETVWFEDVDGDGFGNSLVSVVACLQPTGYILDGTDTDDTNPYLNPNNAAPTANAGADQSITVGEQVTLDGSGSSDPDNDMINYDCTIIAAPMGSTAIITGTGPYPGIIPDVAGEYIIQLVVDDGFVFSDPDEVIVTVLSPDEAVEELSNTIDELINSGTISSFQGVILSGPLDVALRFIDRGQSNVAINRLNSFKFRVSLFVFLGLMDESDAESLIDGADAIIDSLNSGSGTSARTLSDSDIDQHIPEKIPENQVTVYPNPFHKEINVEFFSLSDATVHLELYDINGKRVKDLSTKVVSEFRFYRWEFKPEMDIPSGLYLLTIRGENVDQVHKILYSKQ